MKSGPANSAHKIWADCELKTHYMASTSITSECEWALLLHRVHNGAFCTNIVWKQNISTQWSMSETITLRQNAHCCKHWSGYRKSKLLKVSFSAKKEPEKYTLCCITFQSWVSFHNLDYHCNWQVYINYLHTQRYFPIEIYSSTRSCYLISTLTRWKIANTNLPLNDELQPSSKVILNCAFAAYGVFPLPTIPRIVDCTESSTIG